MDEKTNFEDLISKWDKVKVLVAGDVMLDIYVKGKATRISPEAPVPVVKVESESYVLGGAANVANNISSLKGEVYLCGVIGNDKNGGNISSILKEKGITSLLVTNKDIPTITKTRIIAHHQQILRYDLEEVLKAQPKDVEKKIKEGIEKVIEEVDVIALSDYNKGFFSTSLSKKIIKLANKYGKPVIVDPKPENAIKFKNCTIMCPNHHEAEKITKINYSSANLPKMAEMIIGKLGLKWAIITCGEHGIFIKDQNGDYHHIPAKAKEVYDVTGCGDTVIGVLALNLGAGVDHFASAYIANEAGGIAAGKIGTATITREELLKSLSKL